MLTFFLLLPLVVSAQPLAIEGEVEKHAESAHAGGLPQLDPEFYPSQIFWLLITGIGMYLVMAKIALPRVARLIDMRDDTVRQNLEQASRLRLEAEDIKVTYSRTLRDADERSKALIDRIMREAREKQAQALNQSAERLRQDMQATGISLEEQKDAVLKDASKITKTFSDSIINELGKQAA